MVVPCYFFFIRKKNNTSQGKVDKKSIRYTFAHRKNKYSIIHKNQLKPVKNRRRALVEGLLLYYSPSSR